MAELNKWVPSDVLEPIKRFLDGDLTMTPSIKVEQFVDGTTQVVRAEVPGIDPGQGRGRLRERRHAAHQGGA